MKTIIRCGSCFVGAMILVFGLFAVVRADEHPAGHEHPSATKQEPVAAAPAAAPAVAPAVKPAVTPAVAVTLEGEVLDLSCYLKEGAKGKEHAKCGKECLVGGGTAGLMMVDGSIYVLVEDHDQKKALKAVRELAGMQAKVTGIQSDKGGLKAILVQKVEKGK